MNTITNCEILSVIKIDFLSSTEGVTKKMEAIVSYCLELNYPIHFLIISRKTENLLWLDNTNVTLKLENNLTNRNFLTVIDRFINENNLAPELIYLRHPLYWSRELYNFVQNHKVVFEHNTKEIEEKFSKMKKASALKLVYRFIRYYPYLFLEKIRAPKILSHAVGGIAVTEEIALYQQKLSKNNYTCQVLANGTIYGTVPKNQLVSQPLIIKYVMIIGSFNNWHGIKRLLDSLQKYSVASEFEVHIVGNLPTELKSTINSLKISNLYLHPPQNKASMNEFLETMHCGIGSLQMYMNYLNEASPLKVREYFANGLLCLLGYKDTDVSQNPTLREFVFQLPNDDSIIPFEKVNTFCSQHLLGNDSLKSTIYHSSKPYMHMKNKVKKFYDILNSFR